MIKIIITGHGNYATGMFSALTTISGPKTNITAIDFTDKDTDVTLLNKFNKVIEKENEYLVLCDLLGGTPYKEATKISITNKKVKVITGVNLGAILDISMKLEKNTLDELSNIALESSKKNLKLIDLEIKKEIKNDGI